LKSARSSRCWATRRRGVPVAARAQQPAIPVVGFIDSRPSDAMSDPLRAFSQGLKDLSEVEGENVAIYYRWADNQNRTIARGWRPADRSL
jgi:hypothetical protein